VSLRMKKMMKIINLSILIMLTAACLCYGENKDDKPIDLIHADKFLSSGEDINNILNLFGNVHLRHGTADMFSERVIWYKKTDVVVFIDSVKLIDGSRTLKCQQLTYYRRTGLAKAADDVEITDKFEQLLLTADTVVFQKDIDNFTATGEPVFTVYPDDDSARMVIVGDSIIYNSEQKTGEAVNNVKITRRNMIADCDKADFFDSGQRIVLNGDPIVTHNENVLKGDQIELQTLDRILIGMLIEGNASAAYRSQPDSTIEEYTNATLKGKQLEAYFDNDELTKAVMRRNAVSHYIPAPNDSTANGQNTASGDSITLFFKESDVCRILIIGGAEGKYTEEKILDTGEVEPETTYYDAHEIDYDVDNKLIKLKNNSRLRYQAMTLKSGLIDFDINEAIMIATGFIEQSDSGDTLVQTPVLSESGDELYGQRMAYNIKTRRGKVELGKTEFDNGFYHGKELRQVEKDVLFVSSGEYTTCDLEHPHFHFYCHRMKMVSKDKVIAKPVILFIGPLPVFIIPYYIFPISKGRHSGFLTFNMSNIESQNRFIRNFGYYWAASDYWDIKSSLDFDENKSIRINSSINYALRYVLSGRVSGSFSRQTSWSGYERNVNVGWGINFSHNQPLTETMNLKAGGSFQSSKDYNIDNSYDQDERLRRTVRANASLSKRWKNESAAIALDQNWNLDTDVKTQLLPTITFSRKSMQIFPPPSKKTNIRVLPWEEQPEEDSQKWYNSIYFKISSKLQNRHHQSKKSDSLVADYLDWEKYKTINSQVNLSAPQKLFGAITLNPAIVIKQTFYKIDKLHAADTADAKVATDGYYSREVWSTSLTANTNLYGTVYPNIFYITGLRHVMTPSISYSYAPKTERNKEYYDFTRVGSSSSRRKSMSFGLGNLFQMKIKSGEAEKKIDLFRLSSSVSYDFEKDEQRWSNLSSSINSSALKYIQLSFSAVHDFYDEQTKELRALDPWLKSLSGSMSFSQRFVIFGKRRESESGFGFGDEDTLSFNDETERPLPRANNRDMLSNKDTETAIKISLSHRYTEQRSMGKTTSKTRWLSAAFDLALTAGWHMTLDLQYDMETKRTNYPKFTLERNLHCWAGEFIWRPSGTLAGYYLRIYILQLPDIKIEKSVGDVRPGR